METKVGGIILEQPVMIGAGVCKTPASTWPWLGQTSVVSGSYTIKALSGNEGSKLYYPLTEAEFMAEGYGLNSFGMPNPSLNSAVNEFWSRAEFLQAEDTHPLVISIAGFSIEDYVGGYLQASSSLAKACEGNFGCPNVSGHGDIMSFDPESLEEVFSQIRGTKLKLPLWAKFSPYSNPAELKRVAALVNEYADVVKAVITCNTFPNAYAGEEAISPKSGLAGMSGKALKPIALGQVRQFRQELKPEIDVIGVGGIVNGDDILDFLDAGAKAVQLVSLPFWSANPGQFWPRLLESKRFEDYLEFQGN